MDIMNLDMMWWIIGVTGWVSLVTMALQVWAAKCRKVYNDSRSDSKRNDNEKHN